MKNEDKKNIPEHVGIIIDGNRRWARERNLPTFEGHLKGYEKILEAPIWFFSRGVKILSVFAFSVENWNRSREEVNYLMKLIKKAVDERVEEFINKGYRVLVSGRIDELPGDLPDACREIEIKTKGGETGVLNICLNYDGRAEIIDAIKKMHNKNISLEQIHEGMIKKYLYHNELGDIDLIVRTSGEHRLSGFQLWRSNYSELIFIKKYWPDMEEIDVDLILKEYAQRDREP